MTLEQRRSERLAQRRSGAPKSSADHSDVCDEELMSITNGCPRSPPTPPLVEESEKERAKQQQQLTDRAVVAGSIFSALGVLAAVLWVGIAPLRAYTIVLGKTVHIAPDFVMAALCASWSAGLLYAMREVRVTKSE